MRLPFQRGTEVADWDAEAEVDALPDPPEPVWLSVAVA
jgi:hypothetical protein